MQDQIRPDDMPRRHEAAHDPDGEDDQACIAEEHADVDPGLFPSSQFEKSDVKQKENNDQGGHAEN